MSRTSTEIMAQSRKLAQCFCSASDQVRWELESGDRLKKYYDHEYCTLQYYAGEYRLHHPYWYETKRLTQEAGEEVIFFLGLLGTFRSPPHVAQEKKRDEAQEKIHADICSRRGPYTKEELEES